MLTPSFSVMSAGACVDFCKECIGCGNLIWYLVAGAALLEIL